MDLFESNFFEINCYDYDELLCFLIEYDLISNGCSWFEVYFFVLLECNFWCFDIDLYLVYEFVMIGECKMFYCKIFEWCCCLVIYLFDYDWWFYKCRVVDLWEVFCLF